MKKLILIYVFILFILFLLVGCGTGYVTVGVGVYAPGAWGGPYGAGYYPPVGVGYPLY